LGSGGGGLGGEEVVDLVKDQPLQQKHKWQDKIKVCWRAGRSGHGIVRQSTHSSSWIGFLMLLEHFHFPNALSPFLQAFTSDPTNESAD